MVAKIKGVTNKDMMELMGLTKKNTEELSFLVRSNEDFACFVNDFWQGKTKQFFSISRFRQYKIKMNKTPINTFIMRFEIDPIPTLEKMFQHPVSESLLTFLRKRMRDKKMSLKDIYNKHEESPGYNLKSILL